MATAVVRLQGGFCNRLYILAFLYSYGRRHEVRIKFEDSPNPHDFGVSDKFILDRFYQLENYNPGIVNIFLTLYETEFQFCDFSKLKMNTLFGSYFQNEKYFLPYRKDILQLFRPPDNYNSKFFDGYFIHVRLGDYITNTFHYIDLTKYLQTCLQQTEGPYLLFTNSPEKVFELYPFLKRDTIKLITDGNYLDHFYSMTKCKKGGICSNSSFSAMAAWLNDYSEKKIFLPKVWLPGKDVQFEFEGANIIDCY